MGNLFSPSLRRRGTYMQIKSGILNKEKCFIIDDIIAYSTGSKIFEGFSVVNSNLDITRTYIASHPLCTAHLVGVIINTSDPAKKASLCANRMSFSFLSSKCTTMPPSPYFLFILLTLQITSNWVCK